MNCPEVGPEANVSAGRTARPTSSIALDGLFRSNKEPASAVARERKYFI
jgi:hypothetical protein